MVAYRYKALSASGEKVSGVVEAYDEFEAVAQIKQTCDIVISVTPVKSVDDNKFDINEPLKIDLSALSLISSQFAILIRSGLPTSRCVEIVAEQTSDKLLKKIFTKVAKDVAAGYPLATSLENHGKKIPVAFIETVRAGEESGTLETSFERLAKYYEKSNKLSKKVKSAMAYPAFLMVLAVVVVVVVVNVTIPTVTAAILDTGGSLPVVTQILLDIYNFFKANWPWVIGGLVVLVILFKLYQRSEKGKLQLAKFAYKIPIIKKITIMNAASQFASTMTTLLASGLAATKCLSITSKVLDNYAASTSLDSMIPKLEEGKRLGSVLSDCPYFPDLLKEMTAVGEDSGSLEDTLTTIGAYFDEETERATAAALAKMEPAITVVMGAVIGFILLALYIPMFTMYGGM